jgi:hypothetical protein
MTRSSVFARSDVYDAAEQFVEAIAEHAETIWETDNIDHLAETLTDRAFAVLRDDEATFR